MTRVETAFWMLDTPMYAPWLSTARYRTRTRELESLKEPQGRRTAHPVSGAPTSRTHCWLNVVTGHQVWPDVGRPASPTGPPLSAFRGSVDGPAAHLVEGCFLVMSTTDVNNFDAQVPRCRRRHPCNGTLEISDMGWRPAYWARSAGCEALRSLAIGLEEERLRRTSRELR
jgi:hypothetical protein